MIPFRLKVIICLLIINCSFSEVHSDKSNRCANCEVTDLTAESNFRTVKLSWNYYNEPDPIGFNIKFCELSIWNTNVRCRERLLKLNSGRTRNKVSVLNRLNFPIDQFNSELSILKRPLLQTYDKLIRKNKHHYESFIYDLRTLTNYTFQVTAEQFDNPTQAISSNLTAIQNLIRQNIKDKAQIIKSKPYSTSSILDENVKSIQIETKGFSAKTERCLSNSSDVVINTGPLFNGKISVENSSLDECAVYGNRSYTQEVYHLTILHDKCGSRMNNSRRTIETMIIVHENKDILTHNARRFLVVCSFLPESYTLKASVAMPTNLLRRQGLTSNQINNQLNSQLGQLGNQSPTLYAISRVDNVSLDLLANESKAERPNEMKRNRPVIINRMQRNNHPGTLQDQYYKQKQHYLSTYMLNRPNNTELNNEVVYNFEKLTKNGNTRDARFLLNNQPQHSIVYNTHNRERQNTQFQNYFTMTMVAVGSTCLFVIIIFNFISIPKIWSQPHYRSRQHSHRRYYKEQRREQDSRSKRDRDFRLSLNKHYSNSFNSVSSTVSNVPSNLSPNMSSYQHDNHNSITPSLKTNSAKPLNQLNRYSSPLSTPFSSV